MYFVRCLVLLSVVGMTCSRIVMPCCHIVHQNPDTFDSVSSLDKIFLTAPESCNGSSLASLHFKMSNSTALKVVCGNGFSTMSFLLAILYRLGDHISAAEKQLKNKLDSYIKTFGSLVSKSSTDTLKFKTVISAGQRSWKAG